MALRNMHFRQTKQHAHFHELLTFGTTTTTTTTTEDNSEAMEQVCLQQQVSHDRSIFVARPTASSPRVPVHPACNRCLLPTIHELEDHRVRLRRHSRLDASREAHLGPPHRCSGTRPQHPAVVPKKSAPWAMRVIFWTLWTPPKR
jgi:hypothetical protein